MDLGRVRLGEWLAGLSGLALVLLTFAPWYGSAERGPELLPLQTGGLSAWEAFAVLDVLLVLLGLAGLAVLALAASRRPPALPVAATVVTAALSIVMALLVLYRLLDQPGNNDFVTNRGSAYLGLLAVLLLATGTWLAMGDERTDAEPAPAVPAQPAPPATAPAGSAVARGVAPDVPEGAPGRD